MDNQIKWQSIRSQLDKATRNLEPKKRFDINNKIMKKTQEIMTKRSLSLIYDEYGNQLYEKNSDIQNYIVCKKTGSTFLLLQDDSKLIETKNKNDEFNTDFIQYDTLPDIYENTIKYDMDIDTGFKQHNDYLYLKQERDKRKNFIMEQGINDVLDYINVTGRKELNKISEDFITFIK